MKDNRRSFIKKGATLASALTIGGMGSAIALPNLNTKGRSKDNLGTIVKDAGMQMSEAYFSGMDERRIAFMKQMDVFGAVDGINPKLNGLTDAMPWDPKAMTVNKEAWENAGLKLNVIEGPASLGTKTKLGLAGKDEEIANFITYMKNLKQHAGIDIICYN